MKIHFMGILGSGAAGVADLAREMGYEVSGCDLQKGGHDVGHLKNIDLLVVTPAVFYQSAKHPELVEGRKRRILMTWQEFLGKILLKNKKVICIAGTHGKSTTAAMAAKLLIDNGFDPIAVVGANVPEWKGSSRFGKGEYAVVEADEFNDNFLNYAPEIIIINNIEFDHPDYFKNEAHVKESFAKFTRKLTGPKILITQKDNPGKRFNLKIWGEHNQKNANMVYALGKRLGIEDGKVIKSIENFTGIERRMQSIGKNVYDDYAHHPTAIRATLTALRSRFPKSRIWAVVEAHGYARTKALLPLYKNAFEAADKVIVGPIFKARDNKTFGITPKSVAEASGHLDILTANSMDQIVEIIKNGVKKGDVILVMGAGKSYLWAKEICNLKI